MKTVNLLPEWYFDQQRRGRNLRRHVGFMLLLCAAGIGWTFIGRVRIRLARGSTRYACVPTDSGG